MAKVLTILGIVLRLLLLPLSALWSLLMGLRLLLYAVGVLRREQFEVPVVCIGNVTVGGTGKTPVVEALIEYLGRRGRVGVVSRGYGRREGEQVVVQPDMPSPMTGDEPLQLKRKFPRADVVVDADRGAAIASAMDCGSEVILMDDGLQHLGVRALLNVVCCDAARPLSHDCPLPAGRLRESAWLAMMRADICVVNKCPADLTQHDAERLRHMMRADKLPTYFTTLEYGAKVVTLGGHELDLAPSTKVIALAGVGRPGPFFDECHRRWTDVTEREYDDHHDFTHYDIERLAEACRLRGENAWVVCTEKDAQRFVGRTDLDDLRIAYLPVQARFLFDQHDDFCQRVEKAVLEFSRD